MCIEQKVIVLEPSIEDMWVQSFVGTLIGYEGDKAVVVSNEGVIFKVPKSSVQKPKPIDYVMVSI